MDLNGVLQVEERHVTHDLWYELVEKVSLVVRTLGHIPAAL